MTVGDLVAEFLQCCSVRAAFGVISIHNIPILDAIGRRAAQAVARSKAAPIRFVPARSEGGAVNMADGYARVSGGLGVAITSTGTGAGNGCGALVEALTAGTPILHITGQIDSPYLGSDLGYLHGTPHQLEMLQAVSKAAFRLNSPKTALGTLREAVRVALTPPRGPVSVEIPIDIQAATLEGPASFTPPVVPVLHPASTELDALAARLSHSKRPLLWLGGGARHAGEAIERLVRLGFGVVSSVQGRGIVAEDHPLSLGAFSFHAPVEEFYATCDAMLVVGSRLRSNETLKYELKLPRPLYRIDVDPQQQGHAYVDDFFIAGDSAPTLTGLADRLEGHFTVEPGFARNLARARQTAETAARNGLGPYAVIFESLQRKAGRDFNWVRDVTILNSMWGNRLLHIFGPRDGVHALGGGIGQGAQMALGASLANEARKTLCLVGDGGLQLNMGELATLVQESANVLVLLMNDAGYGVIRNIQDARFGGRRYYVDLHTPDFEDLARSVALPFRRVREMSQFDAALEEALAQPGPAMLEVDMIAVGDFAHTFQGPPSRKVPVS